MVYFIGCLHFGHNNMAKYRGFNDSDAHDEHLITTWNKTIRSKDKVFILGDLTMENSKHYYKIDELNGSKHVVLGNHDRAQDIPELLRHIDKVSGMVDYKGFCLTHCPIHPNEVVFYRGNVHAHIHHSNKLTEVMSSDRYKDEGAITIPTQNKYINVDAHLIGYQPLNFEAIKGI
jgi:calcineurin-like phosphoesterase family protein